MISTELYGSQRTVNLRWRMWRVFMSMTSIGTDTVWHETRPVPGRTSHTNWIQPNSKGPYRQFAGSTWGPNHLTARFIEAWKYLSSKQAAMKAKLQTPDFMNLIKGADVYTRLQICLCHRIRSAFPLVPGSLQPPAAAHTSRKSR